MPDIVEIPVPVDAPSYKIRTILEGVEYVLKFDWNDRFERWHLSIYDQSEVALVVGQPMHVNSDLFGRFAIEGMPPGKFMLFDTSLKNVEGDRESLGDRTVIYYEESE